MRRELRKKKRERKEKGTSDRSGRSERSMPGKSKINGRGFTSLLIRIITTHYLS